MIPCALARAKRPGGGLLHIDGLIPAVGKHATSCEWKKQPSSSRSEVMPFWSSTRSFGGLEGAWELSTWNKSNDLIGRVASERWPVWPTAQDGGQDRLSPSTCLCAPGTHPSSWQPVVLPTNPNSSSGPITESIHLDAPLPSNPPTSPSDSAMSMVRESVREGGRPSRDLKRPY